MGEFAGISFSALECANNRRTTTCLNRKHTRPLWTNPSKRLHFIECFPHSNEPSPAASGIKNYVWQFPVELLRQFITKRLLPFDAIWFPECGHIEPIFLCFAFRDLSAAISN